MHLTSTMNTPYVALRLMAVMFVTAACSASPEPAKPSEGRGGTTNQGAGGASGGTTSASGGFTSATGGFTSSTGGVVGSGGSVTGTGGTVTGTGGAVATGGSTVATGGTTTTPTGGTTSTPTGGTTSTAGTTSSCATYSGTVKAASDIFVDGYGTSDTWMGYAYAFSYGTGVVITPGSSTTQSCFVGAPLCAAGSVPASYEAGAGLGWSLKQAKGASTTDTVTVTGPVQIKLAGAAAGMRVGLVPPAASADEFCYTLTAADVATVNAGLLSIPAASFRTLCYDATKGAAYAGEPVKAIQVSVPGDMAAAKTFDFCIVNVKGP